MEIKTYNNIVGLRASSQDIFGYHAETMDLAQLDTQAWNALQSKSLDSSSTMAKELKEWDAELPPRQKIIKETKVQTLSLNIAQICNLRCTYCGADGDGTYGSQTQKLDISKAQEQIHFFMKKLKVDDPFRIQFLGGEPLLYPSAIRQICEYMELLNAGSSRQVTFSIVTNGTLVSSKIAEMFAKYSFEVTLSLDGDHDVNDLYRPTVSQKGSSTRLTLMGLKNLSAVRDQLGALRVNSVFGAHNVDVESTYEFLRPFDFDVYNFGYASNSEDEKYSPLFTKNLMNLAKRVFEEDGIFEVAKMLPFRRFLLHLESGQPVNNYCGAGKSFLQIDTDNGLSACNWFASSNEERLGQGTQLDLKKMAKYEKPLVELNDCQSCWARNLCGGGCMFVFKEKTGNKHTKDSHFCDRIRSFVGLSIELYIKSKNMGYVQ